MGCIVRLPSPSPSLSPSSSSNGQTNTKQYNRHSGKQKVAHGRKQRVQQNRQRRKRSQGRWQPAIPTAAQASREWIGGREKGGGGRVLDANAGSEEYAHCPFFFFLPDQWAIIPSVQVISKCIEDSPDIYLDEIRDIVKEKLNVTLSLSTIWRFLARKDYTLKKVFHSILFS